MSFFVTLLYTHSAMILIVFDRGDDVSDALELRSGGGHPAEGTTEGMKLIATGAMMRESITEADLERRKRDERQVTRVVVPGSVRRTERVGY